MILQHSFAAADATAFGGNVIIHARLDASDDSHCCRMLHSWEAMPVSSRYSKSTLCVYTPDQGIEVYIREVPASAHWE